jgi:hypothetical protein
LCLIPHLGRVLCICLHLFDWEYCVCFLYMSVCLCVFSVYVCMLVCV